jgi:hypothetical protein
MTGISDELAAFLRDEAVRLERLADSIDVAGSKCDGLARAYSDGAAFSLRNEARSMLERIPTELHDHDWTPADLELEFAGVAV